MYTTSELEKLDRDELIKIISNDPTISEEHLAEIIKDYSSEWDSSSEEEEEYDYDYDDDEDENY